jgi:peptidoglycan-N-acetylglucosamine deacetylase
MRKIFRWLSSRFLVVNTPFTMAIASSIGLFIGMLPLMGIRTPIFVLISILFNINIIALFVGLAITILFPIFHIISFAIAQNLASYQTPFFNLRFLSFAHLLNWTTAGKYHLVGSIIAGLVLAIVAFPFFKMFYSWKKHNRIENNGKPYVFHDHTGMRWGVIKKFGTVFIIVFLIIAGVFGISLTINPFLPNLGLKSIRNLSHISSIPLNLNTKSNIYKLKQEEKKRDTFQLDFIKHRKVKLKVKMQNKKVFAFYVNWDENSLVSLKRNIKNINVVLPNWYVLKKDLTFTNEGTRSVDELISGNNVMNMPLINNYVGDKWDGQLVHKLIADPNLKWKFISNLLKDAKLHKYSGINIDFENIDQNDKNKLTSFMTELSSRFHNSGLKISMDVPAKDSAFDYAALSDCVDYMIVMVYDEHYETGAPGPIASDVWFQKVLDNVDIPSDKLVVSIGNYGYDWNITNKATADSVTFSDVMDMVNSYNLKIMWDGTSGNPYISYMDNGEKHIIWLLDAATMYNQLKTSVENGICGAALWRLGSEDPTIWPLLKNIDNVKRNVNLIKNLVNAIPVHYSREGEVLKIISTGNNGKRSIELDSESDGDIINESYDVYPKPYEVERYGKPKSKEVVLTFDDGPDPVYTPQILEILKKYNVKASFFIVGENGEVNPDIVERIYREGHELGNHTYTHPNVADITAGRTKLELNTTQRLVQELTGHSMIMFRPPYVADAEPSTPNELLPILRAQEQGYLMIGELIDPSDWEQPGSKVIVKRVLQELPSGNVILMHDAGGNRGDTVKALPQIIETLKKKGYKFVLIHDLLHKSRADVMPAVKASDNPFILYDKALFTIVFDWQLAIKSLFYLAILLGIFRFLFLIFFSSRQHKSVVNIPFDNTYKPFVSVVIAAYNEEKVICKTINSILKGDYKNSEIIIVNDGSKDNTAGIIEETYKGNSRVKLINKDNSGKSSSVNVGFKQAKGEIVVALDADTIIKENAISLLVRYFIDENIAAVSGNVKVGNVHNLLTLWQHVEYVTGFNLERRAFAHLNCITVVPGAIGAWRLRAVEKAGYFNEETLAEDTDITLTLLEMGYKIAYEELAYAYTEAPGDLKSLLKQRYRWSYGTLQCLWKHKDALFNSDHKSLGFLALPNMWLFQYVFQSLSPIADIYFVIGLLGSNPGKIMLYYLAFLIIDYMASIYAFTLEKESKKPLIWLFLQRLIYRQFMTYVVLKSIFSALKGIAVGWNKLQRKGNVQE